MLLVMRVCPGAGETQGPHLATGIPLESEFSREYGELCGNDPTANLPEGHEESPGQ